MSAAVCAALAAIILAAWLHRLHGRIEALASRLAFMETQVSDLDDDVSLVAARQDAAIKSPGADLQWGC